MPKRLGRSARIEQSGDFARIRQQGQRLALGCLIANWQRLPEGAKPKLGVVTSKKIGGAGGGNPAPRVLGGSFRQHQKELAQPRGNNPVPPESIRRRRVVGGWEGFSTT